MCCCCLFLGQVLDGEVLMGAFQGIVSHAMHWLWKVSASKYPRDVHYDIKHDDWCYILRSVHRLLHQRYTDDGFA